MDTAASQANLPSQKNFKSLWKLDDGSDAVIRPICLDDEPLMIKFHQTLSQDSVQLRYFHAMALDSRTAHQRLTRICSPDFNRETVLVAEYKHPSSGERQIIAVARLSKADRRNEAEFALLVSDPFQHLGLGTELLRLLTQIGRQAKLARITAYILPENANMQDIAKRAGYKLKKEAEGSLIATIDL